jgi:polysaccharide export outer membrane protein
MRRTTTATVLIGALLLCAAPLGAGILPGVLSSGDTPPTTPTRHEEISPYVLGPGDVLDISVWKHENLQRKATILPDGTISFPLIGQLRASGKTVSELKKEVEERISRYVTDPFVTLSVEETQSMVIYVIGEVNNPGQFTLGVNVNVMQALAMAGGCNAFAKAGNIKILREEADQTVVFHFNYKAVAKGLDLEQNIRLKRGDVIVVP